MERVILRQTRGNEMRVELMLLLQKCEIHSRVKQMTTTRPTINWVNVLVRSFVYDTHRQRCFYPDVRHSTMDWNCVSHLLWQWTFSNLSHTFLSWILFFSHPSLGFGLPIERCCNTQNHLHINLPSFSTFYLFISFIFLVELHFAFPLTNEQRTRYQCHRHMLWNRFLCWIFFPSSSHPYY